MKYPRTWNNERVLQVLTTESRQKERDLFMRTHRPFMQIRVDFCKEKGIQNTFIDEDQLRELVQNSSLNAHNRLFFVVGEAGSGKSELCQWLEYTVDERRVLPFHIPRSMTTATGVAALLRQQSKGFIPKTLSKTPITVQVRHIISSAIIILYEDRSSVFPPEEHWVRLIESHEMHQMIEVYLQNILDGAKTFELLADEDEIRRILNKYNLCSLIEDISRKKGLLREILEQAIEQTFWLGDIRLVLDDISRHLILQNRRPLLLIEDITGFQTLSGKLLDYLFDLSTGHFDAVIGVTSGFESTRLIDSVSASDLTGVHHRLKGRFVLTDDHGCSYGLEDGLIELTRAYLDAVRADCSRAVQEPLFSTFSQGLYPFTETALRRVFSSLYEDGIPRRTPRLFLEHVLAAALLAETPPYLTFDRSRYIKAPPLLFRTDDVPDPHLQSLLRWYGEIDDDFITLDARIADIWGVHLPEHAYREGVYRIPRAYAGPAPDIAINSAWQQELSELQSWLNKGGMYPSREVLKRGIERVVHLFGDPRSLGNPDAAGGASIVYARGDERLPISLGRNSGDQPSTSTYIKLKIACSPDERGILEELAYLALSGKDLLQACRNVALTLEWAQQRWREYHLEVRDLFARHLHGITVEQFIWTSWRLICGLCGMPWDRRPHLKSCDVGNIPYDRVTPWSPERHGACYAAGKEFLRYSDVVRQLFIGTFALHASVLDVEACTAAQQSAASLDVIDRLARVSINAWRKLPFRIRPTGQNLSDLLIPLQRYAHALKQLNVQVAYTADLLDLRQKERHLAAQEPFDHSLLQRHLATLRQQCGEIGLTWRQQWDEALDTLRSVTGEQLINLRREIQRLCASVEARSKEITDDIWQYQQFRCHLRPIIDHPYWLAVATVQTIQSDLLSAAYTRYRRRGGSITNTRQYRQLKETIRNVWSEITDD
ncbi:MAG: ATP-binding protein [Roseiflexus sp.]|nr:ATP-binding protein [Roseiflexus sp.]